MWVYITAFPYSSPNTEKWEYSYGYVAVNPILVLSYDRRDSKKRLDHWKRRYTLSNAVRSGNHLVCENPTKLEASSQTVGKFRREYEISTPKTAGGNGTNFPLLHLLQMCCWCSRKRMLTSVRAPSQKAIEAVNTVRRRAFGKLLPGREA